MNEKIICEERTDEGIRFFKDGCCGTIWTIEAGGDKRVIEVKVIGQMDNTLDRTFESANRIYDKNGLSPTINTCGGGGLQPKVIVASRGRNPENPSDRKQGIELEQRLEPNSEGICNTLTSVQKDNLVLEPQRIGQISCDGSQCGTVYSQDGLSPTLTAGTHGYAIGHIQQNYRIRKLTPLECWRLMGFTDEDFYKTKYYSKQEAKELLKKYPNHKGKRQFTHEQRIERISNTQLYKQAGNSIVVDVLEAIFKQML